jgi:hypothetical protein
MRQDEDRTLSSGTRGSAIPCVSIQRNPQTDSDFRRAQSPQQQRERRPPPPRPRAADDRGTGREAHVGQHVRVTTANKTPSIHVVSAPSCGLRTSPGQTPPNAHSYHAPTERPAHPNETHLLHSILQNPLFSICTRERSTVCEMDPGKKEEKIKAALQRPQPAAWSARRPHSSWRRCARHCPSRSCRARWAAPSRRIRRPPASCPPSCSPSQPA